MGAKGAVEIIFRQDRDDPEKIAAKTKEYEERFANPLSLLAVAISMKSYIHTLPENGLRLGCVSYAIRI